MCEQSVPKESIGPGAEGSMGRTGFLFGRAIVSGVIVGFERYFYASAKKVSDGVRFEP